MPDADPTVTARAELVEASRRIMKRVEKLKAGCWVWTGPLVRGYGNIHIPGVKPPHSEMVHRVIYQVEVGPISEGFQVDHLCHDRRTCAGGPTCPHRACVNPAHLEAVLPRTNVMRSNGPCALNAEKTHCVNGHALTIDNLVHSKLPERECLRCKRERNLGVMVRYRARRRANA